MNSDIFNDRSFQDFPVKKSCLDPDDVPFLETLPETLRVFRRAVGYNLRFARAGASDASNLNDKARSNADENRRQAEFPVGDPQRKVFGTLSIEETDEAPALDWDRALALTQVLATALGDNYRWRAETLARETELAVHAVRECAAPFESSNKTTARLRDVLKTGARALGGFDAASLYLLDSATTSLKLRAVWGLPCDRFLDPPRPLRGSRADVEALLGSAVVLNEAYLAEAWKAPEDFDCSICIPVASESSIYGTIWYFANKKREIVARELDALELIAGRIVAELEKEALRRENTELAARRSGEKNNVESALRGKEN